MFIFILIFYYVLIWNVKSFTCNDFSYNQQYKCMFQDLSKNILKNTHLFIVVSHTFKQGQGKKKKKGGCCCTENYIT